jgi:hypothetical protein
MCVCMYVCMTEFLSMGRVLARSHNGNKARECYHANILRAAGIHSQNKNNGQGDLQAIESVSGRRIGKRVPEYISVSISVILRIIRSHMYSFPTIFDGRYCSVQQRGMLPCTWTLLCYAYIKEHVFFIHRFVAHPQKPWLDPLPAIRDVQLTGEKPRILVAVGPVMSSVHVWKRWNIPISTICVYILTQRTIVHKSLIFPIIYIYIYIYILYAYYIRVCIHILI